MKTPTDTNTQDRVRSMPCSAALPRIVEPTRAGWWVGEFQDGERAVFEVKRDRSVRKGYKNLVATSKHHPIGIGVNILFMRGWVGPFKSRRAAREAMPPNDTRCREAGQKDAR